MTPVKPKLKSKIAKIRSEQLKRQSGVIITKSALMELGEILSAQESFAFDTETVSVQDKTMYGASFCWFENEKPVEPVFVPIRMPNTLDIGTITEKDFVSALYPAMNNDEIEKVGHNLKFDIQVMRTSGILVRGKLFDTLIASWLLDENGQHGLKHLAQKELGEKRTSIKQAWMGQAIKSQIKYARYDAIDTLRLSEIYRSRLQEDAALWKVATRVEFPLIYVIADMEWRGFKLDIPLLEQLHKDMNTEATKLHALIKREIGDVNIDSPKQLAEVLYDKLGLPVVKRSKKTNLPSVDEEALNYLAQHHKVPELIIKYRGVTKLNNTFTLPLAEKADSRGRIHTSFNQTGTVTGRFSSSDPNLQNIPKNKDNYGIRKAFIADKGMTLVQADYSQVELRVMAHFSQDETMIDAFEKGMDIHTRTASEIFSVDMSKVDDNYRHIAKTINFGLIYGQGPRGLSHTTGITESEAAEFINRYFSRFSDVKSYSDGLKAYCQEHGYINMLAGRKRRIAEINSRDRAIQAMAARQTVNNKIQGSASDIVKLAMLKLWRFIRDNDLNWHIQLQVHDELVVEVPEDEAERAAKVVKSIMESVVKLRVPIIAEVSIRKRWGKDKKA